MFNPKIYSASKIWHANKWLRLRDEYGFNIISSWIDIPCGTPEDKSAAKILSSVEKRALWIRVLKEIRNCDMFVIYSEPNEVQNGAIMEMGHAMALYKPVFCIGKSANMCVTTNSDAAFMQYPNVHIFDNTGDILKDYITCLTYYDMIEYQRKTEARAI